MGDELLWAIKNGDMDALKKTADKSGFDVDAPLLNGRNGLHYAADYGQVNVVKYFCEKGAKVDIPDKFGITPLLAAVYEDHVDCVKILIEKGAKKDGKSPDGKSYADCAESETVKALLK